MSDLAADEPASERAGSLYDRRRAFTASAIQDAAFELFSLRGFDEVTVDEVAAAVGISTRTLFRYFQTKEELLSRYLDGRQERLARALRDRPSDERGVTALREAFSETSHVSRPDRAVLLMRYGVLLKVATLRARTYAKWTAMEGPLVAEVANRSRIDPRKDISAQVIVVSMHAVAVAAFERWILAGGRGDPSLEVRTALQLLEAGLGSL